LGERPVAKESTAAEVAGPVVLVDCLTLWLSNVLLGAGEGADAVDAVMTREIERLIAAVEAFVGTLVMVTNEVGSGIVPEYPLGRQYRDWAGQLNRKMASIADQVFLVTAGIPIELKSREYRL
jgi:adenosylcobinamide kinase/adenosylcobinamide-phosphate guanylyltransferase